MQYYLNNYLELMQIMIQLFRGKDKWLVQKSLPGICCWFFIIEE
jgi:hypothetical protein